MEGRGSGQDGRIPVDDEARPMLEQDQHGSQPNQYDNEHYNSNERSQQQQQQSDAAHHLMPENEQEVDMQLQILKALTPEEYLHQTGVFSAMKEALGHVAELRPSNPLLLFAEIMRDRARNTHHAIRQAKLLRHARPLKECAASIPRPIREPPAKPSHELPKHPPIPALPVSNHVLPQQDLIPLEPWERSPRPHQLEILCEPLHRFLCSTTGGCGISKGVDKGSKCGRTRADPSGGRRTGSDRVSRGHEGRARWREVRRFLEALCRGAGVDAECTSVAMAALEREAGVVSTKGEGGKGSPADGDPVVDFASFVASVRAVLLFEGFDREARAAFVSLTGSTDKPASLDDLLCRLYSGDAPASSETRAEDGVGEVLRRRLDVGRRGETKVRLSTITDCVFSSAYGQSGHAVGVI